MELNHVYRWTALLATACLAIALVPAKAAADYDCPVGVGVPNAAGLYVCDTDQDGEYDRVELRASALGGTILAAGTAKDAGGYITQPTTGTYAGMQRVTWNGFTYTCALFTTNTPLAPAFNNIYCSVEYEDGKTPSGVPGQSAYYHCSWISPHPENPVLGFMTQCLSVQNGCVRAQSSANEGIDETVCVPQSVTQKPKSVIG